MMMPIPQVRYVRLIKIKPASTGHKKAKLEVRDDV